MPLWSEILAELSSESPSNRESYDQIRRDYLQSLSNYTGRDTILYASSWLQRDDSPPAKIAIADQDIRAIMEVTSDLSGPDLDVILHSPGGSPAAAEEIVRYLRSRFRDIRVIVPNFAKSAATMIACSANKIVMGKHSFLGPTNPKIPLTTPLGPRLVSAQAILEQHLMIEKEIRDQANGTIWSQHISQFEPGLIETCRKAIDLSKQLVSAWLLDYMFEGKPEKAELAGGISDWISNNSNFISYDRHLSQTDLVERGMLIEELENDPTTQDLSLSVFHAATHLFSAFRICKICESHLGRSFITTY